jgi:hypothetical protein
MLESNANLYGLGGSGTHKQSQKYVKTEEIYRKRGTEIEVNVVKHP